LLLTFVSAFSLTQQKLRRDGRYDQENEVELFDTRNGRFFEVSTGHSLRRFLRALVALVSTTSLGALLAVCLRRVIAG
jgi:hypothetical protein